MDGEKEIVEYGSCAEHTDGELAGAVNEQIKKGWVPWGSPYTTVQYDTLFFHQAMVRYDVKKKSKK